MMVDDRQGPTPVPPPPPGGAPSVERRRRNWQEFRRAYPGILAALGVALLLTLAIDAWILYKRFHYENEIERLREGMSDVDRTRTDAILAAEESRFRVMVELIRRQAKLDEQLHLAVAVDSGVMYLQREGALLREIDIQVGPERKIGTGADTVVMAAPRGTRTVERILGEGDSWTVPEWVYQDRGLPVPEERTVAGALGPRAVILNGGLVIYSPPQSGPLVDPEYVMPGGIRASAEDLRAVVPNLSPGTTVYLY